MVTTLVVISDLHLADGSATFENWGADQQATFEALLGATRGNGALASDTVELIINGDCFDFLLTPPHLGARDSTDVNIAHAKWVNIMAAHGPWFTALREFLRAPGHRVTFIIGNHDMELAFPSVRARVRSAIGAAPGMVRFCLTQAYQPLPDVLIDHGCQFDAYNAIPVLWRQQPSISTPSALETSDARGQPVGPLALPWGSRYFYRAFVPAKRRLRYLDECIPALGSVRQAALLCVLAPDLLLEMLPQLATLLPAEAAAPTMPSADLVDQPAALFMATMLLSQQLLQGVPASGGDDANSMAEVSQLYAALEQGRYEALRAALSIWPDLGIHHTDAAELAAARDVLAQTEGLRYVILGHTHEEGRWSVGTNLAILNTGTWVARKALPHSADFTPEYSAWATEPGTLPYPGRDGRRFIAAWLRSEPGAATVGELIEWSIPTQNEAATANSTPPFIRVPDDAMERW
ncbi:MAG: metallophosphoesterase [Ktedonobacterales bacterium]|nr:metallophosphoesterase [Ktedonobacterales bacterium]